MSGVVDIWCNVFTPEAVRVQFHEAPEIAAVMRWWGLADRIVGRPVDEFVAHMDASGVDAVLVPAVRMGSYRHGGLIWDVREEEVQALVEAAPGRVHGLVGIDPREGLDGVRRLEHWVRDRGFVGALLHVYGFGLELNHRRLYPYYAKCAELGVPIVVQVGHSAEAMPSACGRPLLLDDVALDLPELSIVATHTGWPWVEELVALAWKHPNLTIGTTAHHPRYWDPALVAFARSRGRGQVLFGTDWPVIEFADALAAIDDLGLGDEALQQLLGGAARRTFRLSGAP